MYRLVLIILFSILFYSTSQSQCVNSESVLFNSAGTSKAHAISKTQDGGCVIAAENIASSASYVQLVKLNAQDNVEWSTRTGLSNFNDTGDNILVLEIQNGQFIIAGFRGSLTSRNLQWSLLSSSGQVIWTKFLPLLDLPGETAADIVQLNANEVVIVGTANSFGAGDSDGMIIKFDLSGNIIFAQAIGTSQNDHFYSVEILDSGNLLLSGETNSKAWVVECNTLGGIISSKRIDAIGYSYFMDAEVLNNQIFFSGKLGNNAMFCSSSQSYNIDFINTYTSSNLVGGELVYFSTIDEWQMVTIRGNSFANENSPGILRLNSNGQVLSYNLLNSQVGQRCLIRGQNAIENGNFLKVVSWADYSGGYEIVLDNINLCGGNECSIDTDISVNENISTNLIDEQVEINAIVGFQDIDLESVEVNVLEYDLCEVVCDFSFSLPEITQICENEVAVLAPEISVIGDYSYVWSVNGVITSQQSIFDFVAADFGVYNIELELTDVNLNCSQNEATSIEVLEVLESLILDDLFTCGVSIDFPEVLNDLVIFDSNNQIQVSPFLQTGTYRASQVGVCNTVEVFFDVIVNQTEWPEFPPIYYLCQNNGGLIFEDDEFEISVNNVNQGNSFTLIDGGIFSIELTDNNGCSENFTIEINDSFESEEWVDEIPAYIELCDFPTDTLSSFNLNWSFANSPISPFSNSEGTYLGTTSNECGEYVFNVELAEVGVEIENLNDSYLLCDDEVLVLNSESGMWSFVNQNGELMNTLSIQNPGVYSVSTTDLYGCSNLFNITVYPELKAQLPADICEKNALFLQEIELEGSEFILPMDVQGNWAYMLGENIIQIINECGVYEHVIVVDDCSCLPWVPNSFTANYDGKNDVWGPVFSVDPMWYEMEVFNRWGQMISSFGTNGESQWLGEYGYDGIHFNQIEVYTWILKFQCRDSSAIEEKQGTVTLIR